MRRWDCWGSYIFLRDMQTGAVWSAGYQPSGVDADAYEASFTEERAEISRRDGDWSTTLDVVVSSEDDAEMRRISVTNMGTSARELQVTSYAELSLVQQAADVAHPAFANLFVQTEFVPDRVGRCSPRAAGDRMKKRRCGWPRWLWSKERPLVPCNMKRIVPGFSDADTMSAQRFR